MVDDQRATKRRLELFVPTRLECCIKTQLLKQHYLLSPSFCCVTIFLAKPQFSAQMQQNRRFTCIPEIYQFTPRRNIVLQNDGEVINHCLERQDRNKSVSVIVEWKRQESVLLWHRSWRPCSLPRKWGQNHRQDLRKANRKFMLIKICLPSEN